MNANCSKCRFAELKLTQDYLDTGEYTCSIGCDMSREDCIQYELDQINEDFEYSYAS